ncbi:hypothetical protein PSU4_07340 [Pseudonocardia sulfidoxydans NBRC 16205]|uniref:ABM domain-containing protein n=2 Tax=Pseudonocardia sulfidoxydans TaxID=54011 RepID=A0A511DAE2_9PSEU|nr:antibiotic biosynthesis monooxygenase family protein [Pseudonocardia sulfidoxydans]GEL21780.1 hypothetical protein PSU4_07340 [Pseudonocardia sulfidoxydans NBRC 16205]
MSVLELATMRAREGHGDAMAEALPMALKVVAEAEGCLETGVLRCVERRDEFVLRMRWTEVAAHEAFRDSTDFPRYRAIFADHLAEVVGFAHYTEI